ncbi:MAG: peptidylprolyl isomerase [Deltaproteobacteria bacterium]|nr:peptidylprolyl isomerase [Deltaproteobacteria bacterium]
MKSQHVLFMVGLMVVTLASCSGGSKVLAKVNGEAITEDDIVFLGEINPRIKMQTATPAGKKRVVDNIIEQDLLYSEAQREGVSRDAKVKAKVDLYRRLIVAQSLVDRRVEEAAKKYYNEHQEEFQKLALSHIMIGYRNPDEKRDAKGKTAKKEPKGHTEAEALKIANDIKARLDKGEDFSKLATELSEDQASKKQSGSLGKVWKKEPRYVSRGFEEILEKAFTLKVGEVAGPIKTTKGYHLITVTGGAELQPFEEVKDQLVQKMSGSTRSELLANLKKKAKITYPQEEKTKKAAAAAKTPEAAPPAEQPPETESQPVEPVAPGK